MKKIEYMKPAMRVRQLYLEGSVMDLPIGSPADEVDPDAGGAWAKDFEDDFEYPTNGSVWSD